MPAVSIIIVTYHSRAVIGQALEAIGPSVDDGVAECIVVDNASPDGTADYIESEYPWVHLVRSPGNLGYGRGCNLGFEHADSPFVFVLNPDTAIEARALKILLEFADEHPRCGIAGPAIRESGAHLQAAGLMTTPMTTLRSAFGSKRVFRDRRVIEPGAEPFRTSWVCGAAMLIRSSLFRHLGGFDPRFFLYFEETDLCRRAHAAGFEIWAVGEALISHVGGASAEASRKSERGACIVEYFYPSRYYYLCKHYGTPLAALTEALEATLLRIRSLVWPVGPNRHRAAVHRDRPPLFRKPAASKRRSPCRGWCF